MNLALDDFQRFVWFALKIKLFKKYSSFSVYLVVDGVLEWLVGRDMWRVADEGGANDLEQISTLYTIVLKQFLQEIVGEPTHLQKINKWY